MWWFRQAQPPQYKLIGQPRLANVATLASGFDSPFLTGSIFIRLIFKEMGTDYYKGFYFDKHLAVEDFEKKYVK